MPYLGDVAMTTSAYQTTLIRQLVRVCNHAGELVIAPTPPSVHVVLLSSASAGRQILNCKHKIHFHSRLSRLCCSRCLSFSPYRHIAITRSVERCSHDTACCGKICTRGTRPQPWAPTRHRRLAFLVHEKHCSQVQQSGRPEAGI
jgi:hypothetical protein